MRIHEIRELSPEELAEKFSEKEEEVANLRFQHALHQLDNTDKVRIVRRELARMKTIMQEHKKGIRQLKDAIISNEELH